MKVNKNILSFLKGVYNKKYFFILIILIILATYRGFPSGDNTDSWIQQNRIEDDTYLSGDWYVDVTEDFGIRTYFNYMMVYGTKLTNNIQITNLVFFLIFNFLIVYYLFLISKVLFLDEKKAIFI